MTTMSDLISDTRRHTYGSLNEQINLISANAAAGATSIPMQLDVSGITPGMIVTSGLNVWYTKGIDTGTNSVLVIPGYDNSPKTAVTTDDFVYIRPRVTDWYLFNIVNDEIVSLSSPRSGLYRIDSWVADVDPTWQTYAIPAEDFDKFIGILRIRYRLPGSPDVWYDIPDRAYRIQINPTDGASYIRMLRNIPSGTEIEFIYKSSFSKATALDDDVVTDCGLLDSMVDIPPLGAAAQLLRTTESTRNQITTQGDSRRAAEVGAGSNYNIANLMSKAYDDRLNEEYLRLTSRNPIMRGI